MLNFELTAKQKREWLIAAVLLLGPALGMGFVASDVFFKFDPSFPLPAYVAISMFLMSAAMLAIVTALFIGVWRGGMHRGVFAYTGVIYAGLSGGILMLGSQHAPEAFRNEFFVFGLVLVFYAATAWIRQHIHQSETTTREKLLEIELRLAELAEALPKEKH